MCCDGVKTRESSLVTLLTLVLPLVVLASQTLPRVNIPVVCVDQAVCIRISAYNAYNCDYSHRIITVDNFGCGTGCIVMNK